METPNDPISTEEMEKVVEIQKVTQPNSINLLKTRQCPGHLNCSAARKWDTESLRSRYDTNTWQRGHQKKSTSVMIIKVKMWRTMLSTESNGALKRKATSTSGAYQNAGRVQLHPLTDLNWQTLKGHLDKCYPFVPKPQSSRAGPSPWPNMALHLEGTPGWHHWVAAGPGGHCPPSFTGPGDSSQSKEAPEPLNAQEE